MSDRQGRLATSVDAQREETLGLAAGGQVRKDPVRILYVVLVCVGVVGVLVRSGFGPVVDVDSYWHVLVGKVVLGGSGVVGVGSDWTISPVDGTTWASTQVLAEIVLARLYETWDINGLIVFRVMSSFAIVASVLMTTLWRRPLRAAAWPVVLVLVMLAFAIQERPQQITYALAPLVGWWAMRLFTQGRLPRWWHALPLVAVWGNTHGGWILLPALLVLAALARVLDHGVRDIAVRRAFILAAACLLAAAISPAGFANIVSARRIGAAAWGITEWQPVVVWDWHALPFAILLLLLVVAWARSAARPSRGELLLVLVLCGFGLSAWRNLTPAMLVLAPLVVTPIARWLGEPTEVPVPDVPARKLTAITIAAAIGMCGVSAIGLRQEPSIDVKIPGRLVQEIGATTAPQRVLNTYNVGGAVLLLAGPPPRVRVGIDGRADLYGSKYIQTYMSDLVRARGDWELLFSQLAPTCALLHEDEALGDVLIDRGWIPVDAEKKYVLLRAPDAPGW